VLDTYVSSSDYGIQYIVLFFLAPLGFALYIGLNDIYVIFCQIDRLIYKRRIYKVHNTKKKRNTLCVGHHYAQINTDDVNKASAFLQTNETHGYIYNICILIHFCCTDSLLMTHRCGLSLSIIIWRNGGGGHVWITPMFVWHLNKY
jgi:hypothetical protein